MTTPHRSRRRQSRQPLRHPAQFRTSTLKEPVMLVDLSSAGCRIETTGIHLAEGQRVVVRPQGFEGLCATVIWSDYGAAGLAFETPLYQPLVDHLCRLSNIAAEMTEIAA
ncbi:PilZ domain-containing protein [Sphingobium indicum]|uniref:PilZ domain-containing protein n=1 Tax=Sphingobium indicum TaxID=332055 RepID=UPI000E1C0E8E|nr:PilZ domain-containing protein [Sphingobium indicum]